MPGPAAREFTPAAIENIRYRYVETDESQDSIAADYRMHRTTLFRMAKRNGWPLRKERTRRDLPPGAGVQQALDRTLRAQERPAEPAPPPPPESATAPESAPEPARAIDPSSNAERLERLLAQELSAVELMRAQRMGLLAPRDVEQMTRTLERLTDALIKVRRLQETGRSGPRPDDYDDWPADIDAFRNELARRITAMVQDRYGSEAAEPAGRGDAAPAA
jgi:hypothetical protein